MNNTPDSALLQEALEALECARSWEEGGRANALAVMKKLTARLEQPDAQPFPIQPNKETNASAWFVAAGGYCTTFICEDDADNWLREHGALIDEGPDNPYGPYTKRELVEKPDAQPVAIPDGAKLWLWKNGDHYLAFSHEYPCFEPGGDPMTLGDPSAVAFFKQSYDRSNAAPAVTPTDVEPAHENMTPVRRFLADRAIYLSDKTTRELIGVVQSSLNAAPAVTPAADIERDAARYLWLRNKTNWYVGPSYSTYNDAVVEGEYLDLGGGGVALDSAIDAAMKEQP